MVEMNLSNGQKYSFEMTLSSFHLLRFNVAIVLKEMDDILNRQMFKLLD
jgi:COMM domain containing 5